jgi:Zn-dependent peptidase ImmA (M78 family)
LADRVGLDRTMIAKVEAGRRRLDALELARVSAALGVPMRLLVEDRPAVISRRAVPLTEESDTAVARNSERLNDVLAEWLLDVRQLIELSVLEPTPPLGYPHAVTGADDARRAAWWLRDRLGLGSGPVDSMLGVCERAGQLVLVTDAPGDGASVIDHDVAVAVVSLTGDPGRRRTTAAHELGHLVIGDEYSSDLGVHASRGRREAAIDAFAAEFLLPADVIAGAGAQRPLRDRLVELAARYRTSWSLTLKQADRARVVDADTRRRLNQSAPTRVEFLEAVGWTPQPDLDAVRVPPGYAHAVLEAWRRDLVTAARAVELMRGQIRQDDLPARDDGDALP